MKLRQIDLRKVDVNLVDGHMPQQFTVGWWPARVRQSLRDLHIYTMPTRNGGCALIVRRVPGGKTATAVGWFTLDPIEFASLDNPTKIVQFVTVIKAMLGMLAL